jgi:hypothetical protein
MKLRRHASREYARNPDAASRTPVFDIHRSVRLPIPCKSFLAELNSGCCLIGQSGGC